MRRVGGETGPPVTEKKLKCTENNVEREREHEGGETEERGGIR